MRSNSTFTRGVASVPWLGTMQRGYVLESGATTLSGAASVLLGSDAVQRAYLGA